jgi:hypothetical protein
VEDEIASVAEKEPTFVGAKTTCTVQLEPPASVVAQIAGVTE